MRVALYARISIDPTLALKSKEAGFKFAGFNSQTEENQVNELTQFCKINNYEIHEVYIDRISGAKDIKDRPAFKKLFKDAYMRKFDLVLFWSLDRFSREGTLKTLNYLQELESCKVQWKSFTEQYLDSMGMFKDVIISLMATMAKQERIRISERTKAGIARRKAQGLHIGGTKKKVDEVEYAKCYNQGFTNCALARRFDIAEVTCKRITKELIESGKMESTQAGKITVHDMKKEELRKKFMNLI